MLHIFYFLIIQNLLSLDRHIFFRSPSGYEMLTLIPINVLKPLLYVLDIIKDMVQLLLLLTAVGGMTFALRYWSSFSSAVGIHGRFHLVNIYMGCYRSHDLL